MARLRRVLIQYERVFSGALPPAVTATWWVPGILAGPEWSPPTDVIETGSEWRVTLEVAGLREDEFEIALYAQHMVVRGERPWRPLREAARLHRAEIRHGPVQAAVHVPWRPGSVDAEKVRVEYEDGLLRIHLPKRQEGWR